MQQQQRVDPLIYRHDGTGLQMLFCPDAYFSATNRALLTQFAIPPDHAGAPRASPERHAVYQKWLVKGLELAQQRGCVPLISAVDESESGPGGPVSWVLVTFVSSLTSELAKYEQAIPIRIAAEVHMIYHTFGLTRVEACDVLALRNSLVMGVPHLGAVDVVFFHFRTDGTRARSAWLAEQRRRQRDKEIYDTLLATVQSRLPVVEDTGLRGQGISRDTALIRAGKDVAEKKCPQRPPEVEQYLQAEADRAAARWLTPAAREALERRRAEQAATPHPPSLTEDEIRERYAAAQRGFVGLASMEADNYLRAESLVSRGPEWNHATYQPSREAEAEAGPTIRRSALSALAEEEFGDAPSTQLQSEMDAWFRQQQQQQGDDTMMDV